MINILVPFIFLSGLTIFLYNSYHYLMMIISIEIMMLALIFLFISSTSSNSSVYNFLFFMVIVVCMGSFGITLVSWSYRSFGKDTSFFY